MAEQNFIEERSEDGIDAPAGMEAAWIHQDFPAFEDLPLKAGLGSYYADGECGPHYGGGEREGPAWEVAPMGTAVAGGRLERLKDKNIASTSVGAAEEATVEADLALGDRTYRLRLTLTQTAPAPTVINVREKGAKGDGVTNDSPLLQYLLDTGIAGDRLYFPPGTYLLGTPLAMRHAGLTLTAEPGTATLKHEGRQGVIVQGANNTFDGLTLLGLPGMFNANGNIQHGFFLNNALGTVIRNSTLRGCGSGVYSVLGSRDTLIEDTLFDGWGSACIGLAGPATVRRCRLLQNDPNVSAPKNHAFYIYSGASNIKIEDCLIKAARGYAIHLYGETVGATTGPIEITRTRWEGCRTGFIAANYPGTAARCHDVVLTDCEAIDTYDGAAYLIMQGDRVKLQGCRAVRGGIAFNVGQWNQPGNYVSDVTVTGCEASGAQIGFWANASAGGAFTNVVLGPNNKATNCARPIIAYPTPGLTVYPFV